MAEIKQFEFTFQEVVEALIKQQGITEGIWMISVEFGLSAAIMGPDDDNMRPSAIIPIAKLGLTRTDKESNLSVDASKVDVPKRKLPAVKAKLKPS